MSNAKNHKWTPQSEPVFAAMSVGERVRWLLEVRDMKQTQAAEAMGITQAAVSNIVTDAARKPSAPTLLIMAEVLGCRPSFILDGRGDPFAYSVVNDARQAELLHIFKSLTPTQQDALLNMGRAMK